MLYTPRLLWLFLVCLCLADFALAKESVVWLSLDTGDRHVAASSPGTPMPPGPGEQARHWFVERLTDFRHSNVKASIARIQQMIETGGETYCYANALRTPERESIGLFSETVLHRLPARVVIRRDLTAAISPHRNSLGQVDMASLVNDTELRGAVTNQRSYGAAADRVLAAASAPQRVSQFGTPTKMLMARRVDWIIAEPVEFARQVRYEGSSTAIATRSYEIASQTEPVLTYVMCSRTASARRLIANLNRLMSEHAARPWERPYIDLLDTNERADLARITKLAKPR